MIRKRSRRRSRASAALAGRVVWTVPSGGTGEVGAASDGDAFAGVEEVEGERGVDGDGGVERGGEAAGAVADAGDGLSGLAGGMKRDGAAVAGDDEGRIDGEAGDFDLHAFERGVDAATGAAGAGLFGEDVPGFEGLAELELDALGGDGADFGEAELVVGGEPGVFEGEAGLAEVSEDFGEILLDEVGEHEAIVEGGSPAEETAGEGLLPEGADEGADKEHFVDEAHAEVRRHFKGAELEQAETQALAFGGIHLVDAELGAVGVAGDVDEEVAEEAVEDPGMAVAFGEVTEGELELVEGVGAGLVDAGGTGWWGRRTCRRRGRRARGGAARS